MRRFLVGFLFTVGLAHAADVSRIEVSCAEPAEVRLIAPDGTSTGYAKGTTSAILEGIPNSSYRAQEIPDGTGGYTGRRVLTVKRPMTGRYTVRAVNSGAVPVPVTIRVFWADGTPDAPATFSAAPGRTPTDYTFTCGNLGNRMLSVTPSKVTWNAGGTISVTGKGFDPEAQVLFDDILLPTTFLGPGQLQATVPANFLTNRTNGAISVWEDGAPAGRTNAMPLNVVNPVPTITGVDRSTFGKSYDQILVVTGTGLSPATKIMANGTEVATYLVSPTRVGAVIPAALWTGSQERITLVNPAPGGGVSAPTYLNLAYVFPTLTVNSAVFNWDQGYVAVSVTVKNPSPYPLTIQLVNTKLGSVYAQDINGSVIPAGGSDTYGLIFPGQKFVTLGSARLTVELRHEYGGRSISVPVTIVHP